MTAIEWLEDQICTIQIGASPEWLLEAIEKAKEMEKQQMFEYIKKHYVIGENSLKFHKEQFEEYYKETFKSE